MSDTIIQVENLSKKYIIGHQHQKRYVALRDVLADGAKSLMQKLRYPSKPQLDPDREEFWALKDVSFEVKRGDRVGIIGRNGAGKSTLLKILSRITEPTGGRIAIKGRVASLLEVGTGFHPELTGRENIFLNGAILGMTRVEIYRKFDEIVQFAEIEKFLDTPVKHYSSGMYIRLAFAVAAHLEPELLIVDEVLAVGDAAFQKKCMGKMEEVSTQGRTILFVSHNSSAIANLCDKGLVLEHGRAIAYTSSLKALNIYANALNQNFYVGERKRDKPSILKVEVEQSALEQGDLKIVVRFTSPWVLDPPLLGVVVYTLYGMPLFGINTWQSVDALYPMSSGIATLTVKNLPLHSGTYKISVWLGEKKQSYDVKTDILTFDFISPDVLPGDLSADVIGTVNVKGSWSLKEDILASGTEIYETQGSKA
ncbi:ABC transporter domain-containing protein [Tumidithrix helvetica PCC 7403]|uniref:ABC transporter ATP-binding protein n=1 Tax=Tumidithrix helvetica TaxID=3457545 RepID=UPI003CAA7EDC